MNTINYLSFLIFFLISSLALSVVYLQLEDMYLLKAFASSSFSSNTSNVVAEGNSTYSNSIQGVEQGVSKVIVIPNPNHASPPALRCNIRNLLTHNTSDFERFAHLITVMPLVPVKPE